MKIKSPALLTLAIGLLVISCNQNNPVISAPDEDNLSLSKSNFIYREPYNWEISTPEEERLNPDTLAKAFEKAENLDFLYSLLIIKNGKLVAEKYYNGKTASDPHDVHSVSKSFTSALIGIAIDKRFISSVNKKIMDYFPEYRSLNIDQRIYSITIGHLLTMTGGFDWGESIDYWVEYMTSPDRIKYILELPLRHNPGEDWNYSSVQTDLLSIIVSRASGMTTYDFAEKYLFEPLDITIRGWIQYPGGWYSGGHKMFFAPRDMARFGYLYLNNGKINSERIIAPRWINDSIEPIPEYNSPDDFFNKDKGYGYCWWLSTIQDHKVYSARGRGGQSIFVIPDSDLIVVTTCEADQEWSSDTIQYFLVTSILAECILPALHHNQTVRDLPAPPIDLTVETVENRSFTQLEYINILKWDHSSENADKNIIFYRIYLLNNINDPSDRSFLALTGADTREFLHRNVQYNQDYIYGIAAVEKIGNESALEVISLER